MPNLNNPKAWTDERRAKFRRTMAQKKKSALATPIIKTRPADLPLRIDVAPRDFDTTESVRSKLSKLQLLIDELNYMLG